MLRYCGYKGCVALKQKLILLSLNSGPLSCAQAHKVHAEQKSGTQHTLHTLGHAKFPNVVKKHKFLVES